MLQGSAGTTPKGRDAHATNTHDTDPSACPPLPCPIIGGNLALLLQA